MKKKATVAIQPDKVEASKSEVIVHHVLVQKIYRDHSFCDHSHGRVNKFPFGSGHGPMSF